jgi:hypothetical protein
MARRLLLPVSGLRVGLRELTGREELLLAERPAEDPSLVLALAGRLGQAEGECDWAALPVHDASVLIARLRQAVVGDRITADIICRAAGCGQRVDLSFSLERYLAHHRPRAARGRGWAAAPCADAPGWNALHGPAGETVRFRIPTLRDQIEVDGEADPAAALVRRCVAPASAPARVLRRVEVVLEAMAPALAGMLQGKCPECGQDVEAWFDVRLYCVTDLCARARFVLDDIDLLAQRYHWPEQAILRLPRARREHYVERARMARAA